MKKDTRNIENELLDEYLDKGYDALLEKRYISPEYEREVDRILMVIELTEAGYYNDLKSKIKTDLTENRKVRKSSRNLLYLFALACLFLLGWTFYHYRRPQAESVTKEGMPGDYNASNSSGNIAEDHKSKLNLNGDHAQNRINNHGLKSQTIIDTNNTNAISDSIIENKIILLQPPQPEISIEKDAEIALATTIPDKNEISKETEGCQSFQSSIDYQTTPTCKNANSGKLSVNIPKNINAVYDGLSISNYTTLDNLPKGQYRFYLTDEKNCKDTLIIPIEEKNCTEVLKFNFNPNYEQFIEIETSLPAKMEIRNKHGKLVTTLNGNPGQPFTWYGNDNSGNPMEPGTYIYISRDKDSQIISSGQITLMR